MEAVSNVERRLLQDIGPHAPNLPKSDSVGCTLREALEPERRRHAQGSEGEELAKSARPLEADSDK